MIHIPRYNSPNEPLPILRPNLYFSATILSIKTLISLELIEFVDGREKSRVFRVRLRSNSREKDLAGCVLGILGREGEVESRNEDLDGGHR